MIQENELNYTQLVNSKVKAQFEKYDKSVIFGQNIVAGSRISGLGSGLDNLSGATAINSTNSENSLMGMGFGLSLSGIPSLLLMKQHDFALLGLDQLINTNNVLRNGRLKSPFIVLMVIVDSGFEGPQASLNSLDEFASLTKAPVHFLSTMESIETAFEHSESPGLHFLALSQLNMKRKVLEATSPVFKTSSAIKYKSRKPKQLRRSITIVMYGVEIGIGLEVIRTLETVGLCVDLFVMCELSNRIVTNELMNELQNYDEVVVIDTGKSDIHFSSDLTIALLSRGQKVHQFQRNSSPVWSEVSSDLPEFSVEKICTIILREPLVP